MYVLLNKLDIMTLPIKAFNNFYMKYHRFLNTYLVVTSILKKGSRH